eukprot:807593-Rhodomonas_salina.1
MSEVVKAITALAARMDAKPFKHNSGGKTGGQNSDKHCTYCDLPGHTVDSPCLRKQKGYEGLVYCRVCGGTGHHWR